MSEYKVAKEAFVADNPGSSIQQILAISLPALTSYALYATYARSNRVRPIYEYMITIWPLLLSVTIFANKSYILNGLLLGPVIITWFISRNKRVPDINGHTNQIEKRSKGQWLDESDSDEEPAVPTSSTLSTPTSTLQLPSEIVPSPTRSHDVSSPTPSPVRSPQTEQGASTTLSPESPGMIRRKWKKRHSPTPSTFTHTTIDILPTPEPAPSSSMSDFIKSYPANPRLQSSGTRVETKRKLPFLSVYRAHMMVMTIHCILAVDFKVFPRSLGKCEDFGTSLMDVGVGSFVFALGMVSTRAFIRDERETMFWAGSKSLRKSVPVLLLGLVRVLMVKGTEYPEHVTEYGVHWNFFFTLGLLPLFGTLFWPIRLSWIRWSAMGLLLTITHQALLSGTSLQLWTLSAIRNGLIGMNKEGVVSLPGYLALYFLGLATGEHISRVTAPGKIKRGVSETEEEHAMRHSMKRKTELALELFSYAVGWWSALALCYWLDIQVSRRLANLPYVLWTAAYNTSFLFGTLIIELIFFRDGDTLLACPAVLEAINANGLVIFLVANLLTGLINVSIQTMYAAAWTSMLVLQAYSAAICGIAWSLRKKRLKL